jgi:hypothetical protein
VTAEHDSEHPAAPPDWLDWRQSSYEPLLPPFRATLPRELAAAALAILADLFLLSPSSRSF